MARHAIHRRSSCKTDLSGPPRPSSPFATGKVSRGISAGDGVYFNLAEFSGDRQAGLKKARFSAFTASRSGPIVSTFFVGFRDLVFLRSVAFFYFDLVARPIFCAKSCMSNQVTLAE